MKKEKTVIYYVNNDDFVVLFNVVNDKFYVLNEQQRRVFKKTLSHENLHDENNDVIIQLSKAGVFRSSLEMVKNECKENIRQYSWKKREYAKDKLKINFLLMAVFFVLFFKASLFFLGINRTCSICRGFGLFSLKERKNRFEYFINAFYFLSNNSSFRYRCLEHAIFCYFCANICGLDVVLKIGVNKNPFISHAWVEINGEVFNDDNNLNDFLYVIFKHR